MSKEKAWLSWSSGKDAAWALHVARQDAALDVVGLLTTVTREYERVSMHAVRERLLEMQAAAVGLPLHKVYIPAKCSNEDYEAAMRAAIDVALGEGITRMAFGDLFLEDVRRYRIEKLAGTGIEPVFPVWGFDTGELSREMVSAGVGAYVTCIDPGKMPRELAGAAYDGEFLAALPEGVDPCGEKGEFHTCVFDGPAFERPIPVRVGETLERDGFVFTDVLPIE